MEQFFPGDSNYSELKNKLKISLTKKDSKTVDIVVDSAYFLLGELHFLSETLLINGLYQSQAEDIFNLKNDNISILFKANSNAINRTIYNSFYNMLSKGNKNTQVSFQQIMSFFVSYDLKERSEPQLLDNIITKKFLNDDQKRTGMLEISKTIIAFLVKKEYEISYIDSIRHRISAHNSVEKIPSNHIAINNVEYIDNFIRWTQSLLNIILDTNKTDLEKDLMYLSNTISEITVYLNKLKMPLGKESILYKE